jgi:hypothetical protein
VARLVPDVGFKFAVHDQFKLMFQPPDGSPLGVQEKMAAGAATGESFDEVEGSVQSLQMAGR